MSLNWPNSNYGFVPEYQASGWPFVKTITGLTTGSVKIEFPNVIRWFAFSVHASSHRTVRVGFTENGVNDVTGDGCYFLLETDNKETGEHSVKSLRFEMKCKELWFRTDTGNDTTVSVIAGYTGIQTGSFPTLTGSAGWIGVG